MGTQAHYIETLSVSGRFGTVWKAELVSKNKAKVAVKSLARIAEDFREEVTIMSDVVHPNIVRLYGLINYGKFRNSPGTSSIE